MKIKSFAALVLLAFSILDLQCSTARAQDTAFSYQGNLSSSGAPANGSYDMAFTLYATNLTGVPIAGPVTNAAIAVSNGLFSTSIDFGNVYSGESNWLEIAVSTNQANAFTTLAPRQQLMPVPYAVTAANLSGTVSSAQLPASVVTNGSAGVNISGTFSGNGAGITNVPGAIPWQAVSGSGQTVAVNQAYLLTNSTETSLVLPGTANVGDIVTVSGITNWIVDYDTAGSTWTAQNSAIQIWQSFASSLDGTKLVAVAFGGPIYTSTNSGMTWTAQTNGIPNKGNQGWQCVASSSDGTHLVAGIATGGVGGPIYTSANSGATWTESNTNYEGWFFVTSSSDGTHLTAGSFGYLISTSTNSGATWTPQNSSTQDWTCGASSSDGTHLVAATANGQIYTSTNSGVIWTAQYSSNQFWNSVASSSDGTKLVAVADGGPIYTSTNSGVTWTAQNSGARDWNSVASSSDGTHLIAGANISPIYTSTNSGVTWAAENSGTQNWYSVASSADGTKLVAGVFNGQIYTSDATTFFGLAGTTAQFQYIGNGQWQPVEEPASQIAGTVLATLLYYAVTNTETGVTLTGAFNGNGAGLTNLNTANLTGQISATSLPAAVLTNTETGVALSGAFSGDGSGLTNVNAVTVGGSLLTGSAANGLVMGAPLNTEAQQIYIKGLNDQNHGLQSSVGDNGGVTNFAPLLPPDGPVLWGAGGGALGSVGGGYRLDLVWTPNGIGIGTNTPVSALQVVGTVTATNFSGSGSGLTNLNAAQLSSGMIPVARLGGITTNILTSSSGGHMLFITNGIIMNVQ